MNGTPLTLKTLLALSASQAPGAVDLPIYVMPTLGFQPITWCGVDGNRLLLAVADPMLVKEETKGG